MWTDLSGHRGGSVVTRPASSSAWSLEEYARHNGDADLLREAVDGVDGVAGE